MRLFGKRSHFNFDEIFHQYKGTVYKIIRRTVFSHDDAMDISQNVFINIYKYLPNFKGDSDISTWIYRITVNETSRFFTQKYEKQKSYVENFEQNLSDHQTSYLNLSEEEIEAVFEKALASLPEKQRIVFSLRYYEEMPYQQMSEVLNTSEGALKASYHQAVKKIEDFFKRY